MGQGHFVSAGLMLPKGGSMSTTDDLSAAAVHSVEHVVLKRCKVAELFVFVTGAATVGAAIITFRKRPLPGSSTGQSTIGTVTVPGATADGKLVGKLVTPVVLEAGASVAFEITSAGTSGSVLYSTRLEPDYEGNANEADYIVSA
jgi:hypothetical protein